MKKLKHRNLVTLHEVIDDPAVDALYLVLEYCAGGPILRPGVDEPHGRRADGPPMNRGDAAAAPRTF